MPYSFNLITLPSECDSLTKIAERDKRTLEARKQSLEVRTENSAEDVAEIAADLAAANASLTASIALIASLPEGETKEKEITKRMELELRIRKLNTSGSKLNPVGQLEREYDVDLLDAQTGRMEAFIAAVAAHKASL